MADESLLADFRRTVHHRGSCRAAPGSIMRRFITLIARLTITAVVLFWSGFVLLDGTDHLLNDPDPATTARMMAFFLVPLLTLLVLAWRWPRLGAFASLGLAGFVFYYFPHEAPRLMGALPLAIAGVLLLAAPRRGRIAAPPSAPAQT
ncbi:MAG: hypothetical protein AB7V47_00750 [Phycisphaerales bacterium]